MQREIGISTECLLVQVTFPSPDAMLKWRTN